MASIAKRTYDNMVRAIPALQRKPTETETEWRARVLATVAKRWGYSAASLPSYLNTERRVKFGKKHSRFFADVVEYGALKFDEAGRPVPTSIGKGPDAITYLDRTPVGGSRRARE